MKTTHTVTGQSSSVIARGNYGSLGSILYYVDFTTGGGSGSATLEVQIDNDWVPVDSAQTATMPYAELVQSAPFPYRWNVTVSGGSIITYLA
jgi:hypothetical protein